jgi:hypothetical protein
MLKKFIFFVFITSFLKCSYPEISRDELVYDNDFENSNLKEIDGGLISNYNNENVLGDFNNDGFTLHLNDIGKHDFVYISFDLYVHGSWDGNSNGFTENDKPDLWRMELRPEMQNFQNKGFHKFETTFSNSPCFSSYCLRQSYPNVYPFDNNPKTGSSIKEMPINCKVDGWNNVKTTLYKIEKGFQHTGNALIIRFEDELFQPNAIDFFGNSIEKCDESWSLDNLKVRIISYK